MLVLILIYLSCIDLSTFWLDVSVDSGVLSTKAKTNEAMLLKSIPYALFLQSFKVQGVWRRHCGSKELIISIISTDNGTDQNKTKSFAEGKFYDYALTGFQRRSIFFYRFASVATGFVQLEQFF